MLLSPFEDPNTQVVYPPAMHPRNAVRPGVRFYSRFPILTDCIAWRTSAISAEEMALFYSSRIRDAKSEAGSLVEFAWHTLITNRFQTTAVAVDALANPTPMHPKLYLRKASALDSEYQRLAAELGCHGMFDTREWLNIEGHKYMCRPTTV